MNAASPESSRAGDPAPADAENWSPGRWFFYVTLAFAVHVGLFYLLADRQPVKTRPGKKAAALRIAQSLTEVQELADPTLFALPHPRGFAGTTWLPLPQLNFAPFRWTEAPRLLPVPVEQLGAVFLRVAETNVPTVREIAAVPVPLTAVLPPAEVVPLRRQSIMRASESLADRSLRNPGLKLPLQRAQDGLTNTVVQVLVDARGQVVSSVIVPPGSGLKEADRDALRIARGLWFKPQPENTAPVVGRLIFEWAITAATNSTPGKP